MQINQLFPTAVALVDLPQPISSSELDFIKCAPQCNNIGNTSSMNNYILDQPELADLKAQLQLLANEYFQQVYQPPNSLTLRITQSWANYTSSGQFHHKHAHPNSLISCVLYVASDPNIDRIYFYRGGYRQLSIPPQQWNLFNSESWWFPSITNQLIIFPSHLEHMVENRADSAHQRISLSFNTFPVGNLGLNHELTELFV